MRGLIRTGGGGTSPTTTDSSGNHAVNAVISQGVGADPIPVQQGPYDVVAIAASQANFILGTTGAAGDFLHTFGFRVNGTGTVSIANDGVNIFSYTGVTGVNHSDCMIIDGPTTGVWTVTTTSGAVAYATGIFT